MFEKVREWDVSKGKRDGVPDKGRASEKLRGKFLGLG